MGRHWAWALLSAWWSLACWAAKGWESQGPESGLAGRSGQLVGRQMQGGWALLGDEHAALLAKDLQSPRYCALAERDLHKCLCSNTTAQKSNFTSAALPSAIVISSRSSCITSKKKKDSAGGVLRVTAVALAQARGSSQVQPTRDLSLLVGSKFARLPERGPKTSLPGRSKLLKGERTKARPPIGVVPLFSCAPT